MIGREHEVASLEALTGLYSDQNSIYLDDTPVGTILIYGYPSTDKEDEHERATKNIAENDDEARGILNFLGFISGITKFVIKNTRQEENESPKCDKDLNRPKIFLVLDDIQYLLDRGYVALVRNILKVHNKLSNIADICLIIITQGISPELEKLTCLLMPAHVHFPLYTEVQVEAILINQLQMQDHTKSFKRWLKQLRTYRPTACNDWLELRCLAVKSIPDFYAYLKACNTSSAHLKKLHKLFLKSKFNSHQGSYGKLDPTLKNLNLSLGCLLLVISGYIASFNHQETDSLFLSTSTKRKRSRKPTPNTEKLDQLKIGPKTFQLQRLLAIYLSLREEDKGDISERYSTKETREDIYSYLAVLVRMQLFQRVSPPEDLDDVRFRCLADADFVKAIANHLHFPLEKYLDTPSV